MTHSSRISIVLPVTFAVIWIALICLAIPDFAVASTRVAGNGHFQTAVDGD